MTLSRQQSYEENHKNIFFKNFFSMQFLAIIAKIIKTKSQKLTVLKNMRHRRVVSNFLMDFLSHFFSTHGIQQIIVASNWKKKRNCEEQ